MPGRIARGRLPWALMVLAFGYTSLVAGPLWNARATLAHWLDEVARDAAFIPQPIAIGIALFGAAALVFVVARQVRDVELHPYGSLAPVLAVFSGLVLTGLRSQLPFPGTGGAQLGLAALSLALMGGALIGRAELSARVLGWALTVLPSLALLCALTAVRGDRDPIATLQLVDAPLRAYLALLAASSVALGLIGNFAHHLARKEERSWAPPSLRLSPNAVTPTNLRAATMVRPPPMRQTRPLHHESPAAFAASYVPGSEHPRRAALALDELELKRMRGSPYASLLWLAPAIFALAAVAAYFLMVKPDQERVQAVTARATAGTEQLADRMSRYLTERQREHVASMATKPVVTSLSPTPATAPAVAPTPVTRLEVAREELKPERAPRRHHRSRRERKVEPKPIATIEAKVETKVEKVAKKLDKPEPAKTEPAKPTPNERDLDLDALVQKALKSGKQAAADDPILGL